MGVGVDLLVYSDGEASRRSQVPGTVLYRAFKEGYDDTDIPLIQDAVVEKMVGTMRQWAGEVVK